VSDLLALDLHVTDRAEAAGALERLGFEIGDGGVALGSVTLEITASGPPHGLAGWAFAGDTDERLRLDPTTVPPTDLRMVAPAPSITAHPNGTEGLDHVVVMVPRLETTVAGLEEFVGTPCRRRGEVKGMPAAFLRAGSSVLEIIELRSLPGPKMWGVAVRVGDCDKTVAVIRERGGEVTDPAAAAQGGRIAQVPTEVLGMTLAFMEPPQPAGA